MAENKRTIFKDINQKLNQITTNDYDKQQINKITNAINKDNQQRQHYIHIAKKKETIKKAKRIKYLIQPILILLKQMAKQPVKISYYQHDESLRLNNHTKYNKFVDCHCLIALRFAKIINIEKKKTRFMIKIGLTHIGKAYVKKDLKISHKSKISANIINFIKFIDYITQFVFVITCLIVLFLNKGSLVSICLVFGIELFGLLLEFALNSLIDKNKHLYSDSTRRNFKAFLKFNHIKEPNCNFDYKDNMPLLSDIMFK